LNLWRQKYTDGRLWIDFHHAREPIEGSHVSETLETDGWLWIVFHHAREPIEGSHVSETLETDGYVWLQLQQVMKVGQKSNVL
jgi:hypothetical protein